MRLASAATVLLVLIHWHAGHSAIGHAAEDSDEVRRVCLEVLREGVRSDEFWPSIHAAEALTLAGHAGEVRELLAPKLTAETDDQRRCGLSRELVRAGDRSQAAVMLRIIAGDDAYGHVHAAESLYKVWEVGDGLALRGAMALAEIPNLKLMAAGALARCGSPRAMALLRKTIRDDDPEVRKISAWLLARLGDNSDIPAVREGLARAETDPVRCFFEHALATLGDTAGLRALASNLNHEDPAVRVYAATFAGDARATSLRPQLIELLRDPVLDVRVRAAQSLLVLSQPAPDDPFEEIVHDVYPASPEHPRYSEGSIIALADGSLLYATTEFIKGGSDFSSARIVARVSANAGRTWSPLRVLQENVGKQNVMSVTLRRLASPDAGSPIGMFYLVKNGYDDLDVYLRISHDESVSFGEPILVTDKPGYHVLNNDRVTLLRSGRLLVPVASTADVRSVNHFVSHCFLSDDGGQTWRDSRGNVDLAKRGAMEPEVFEKTRDGRVGMILRTQLGHIAVSYSSDDGDTWSDPKSLGVTAPESPATLRRIPATGDLLLVWNDTYQPGTGHGGRRTPLTAAISSDEGESWSKIRNLETSPDETFAYTSLTFDRHRAVLSYYVEKGGKISSRFRSIPVRSLYSGGH
jgi:sialidase-1